VGRDEFFAPHAINFDGNIQKNTKISERLNVQFRAEFFNLLNRRNYANPGFPALVQGGSTSAASVASGTTNSSFGQITSVLGYPLNGSAREIQFGLKFIF